MPKITAALRSVAGWLEARTGLAGAITPAATHPVPRRTASWWYVFGSATLTLFIGWRWKRSAERAPFTWRRPPPLELGENRR
jgi:hypothetical protein